MSKKHKPKARASATEFTEALEKLVKRELYKTLYMPPDIDHDGIILHELSEADMAKIPGDMGKARSPSTKVRDRAETLAEVMERVKVMGMDEETRKVISDMLGTVRPSAPAKPGRPSFSDRERIAREKREMEERWEAARVERERIEALEAERARKAAEERAMRWEEESRLRREREEAARRLEEERERIRAIERKRARKQEVLREWQSILAEEAGETHDLKLETATVSVNPAKACVTVRCPFNATFAGQMCAIKGVSFADGLFECTSEAMKQVKPLLAKTFKDVQMIGVPKVAPVTKFDALMAKLDKEDRSKIYKLLALKYHVDKGGRHDMMVLINQVFKES